MIRVVQFNQQRRVENLTNISMAIFSVVYQDQRVKWYGSPFEARLEKALYSEEHGGCL